jgi:hypothetical protein
MRKKEHEVGSSITIHLKHADGWAARHEDIYMGFVFSWILSKDIIITTLKNEKVKYARNINSSLWLNKYYVTKIH